MQLQCATPNALAIASCVSSTSSMQIQDRIEFDMKNVMRLLGVTLCAVCSFAPHRVARAEMRCFDVTECQLICVEPHPCRNTPNWTCCTNVTRSCITHHVCNEQIQPEPKVGKLRVGIRTPVGEAWPAPSVTITDSAGKAFTINGVKVIFGADHQCVQECSIIAQHPASPGQIWYAFTSNEFSTSDLTSLDFIVTYEWDNIRSDVPSNDLGVAPEHVELAHWFGSSTNDPSYVFIEDSYSEGIVTFDFEACAPDRENGNVNLDMKIDLSDAVYLLNWLFLGGPPPTPIKCLPLTQNREVNPQACQLPSTGQSVWFYKNGGIASCDDPSGVNPPAGQDGRYQAGIVPEGRFVDNGDGTVADIATGLMWQKLPGDVNKDGAVFTVDDSVDWEGALRFCESSELANHSDWRLPNVLELQSIVNYGPSQGPTPAGLYAAMDGFIEALDPDMRPLAGVYWSSTSTISDKAKAFVVDFNFGTTVNKLKTVGDAYGVRAVRAGKINAALAPACGIVGE